MLKGLNKFLLGLMYSVTAYNAYAIELPGAVQPQQVSKTLRNQELHQLPGQVYSPARSAYQPTFMRVKESSKQLRFKLNHIVLIGNTVFSESELRQLYAGDLHRTITLNRLLTIVQSITDYYRRHGYVSSQAVLIPQRARHGIVKIKVIEGYVANVSVVGCPGNSRKIVQAFGNNVQQCYPLNNSILKKNILLANEIPGTNVKAVLVPSKTQANASDLILMTQHQPVNGYIAYDNYGTRYIGPQQISANIRLNSLGISGDSAQLTLAKTPKGRELSFADLNYGLPLNYDGDRLLFGATLTKTHPLFVLRDADIDGLNKNYYGALTVPYIRSRDTNLTFLFGLNLNNTHVTSFDAKLYEDNIRSLALGLLFDKADCWHGSNSIYADLRQGLPIWGYTTDTTRDTAQTSRPGGRAVYTKIDFSLSRLQALKNNFSLYGLIRGQYGFQALLTAEQFAFGGSQLGRAYDPAELLGDKGLGATLEARYDWEIYQNYISGLEAYAFYDIGKVWNYFANPGLLTTVSAASTGAGVRFNFTPHISGNVWIAQPLTKSVAAEAIVGNGNSARGFFSIVASL